MSKTVIKFHLGVKDINRAIRELNKFKEDFRKKVDTYRKRIAEEIAVQASLNFGNSMVDDPIKGGSPRKPDVQVYVSDKGGISVVVADGEDAVWCEFGAGVYHNGSVGSSPNPYGNDLGFTIGSYGKGKGKQQVWGYYDESDNLVLTRGTPATMPMYNATQDIMRKSVEIAREVFG
jgi:hypothetical protein